MFASSKILPVSAVVVVFPFVPVMATIGPGQNQLATSSSLTTCIPRATASFTSGTVDGTPGLSTSTSASAALAVCPPNSAGTPMRASSSGSDPSRAASTLLAQKHLRARRLQEAGCSNAASGTAENTEPLARNLPPHRTLNVARLRIIRRMAII